MPVSCSESVLTGQDGSVWFTPAGTSHCLLDHSDFPAGVSAVAVPVTHDFKPGDPVVFRPKGGVLDSALTANTTYFIGLTQEKQVQILASLGGAPVLFAGDGGSGSVDTPGGHIQIEYASYGAVAQVAGFRLNLLRRQLSTTSLPEGVSRNQGKYASFQTRQAGYADGTGSMTVRFARDQKSLASRLLANSMLRSQNGARVRLYIDTISNGNIYDPAPDNEESSYFDGAISIEGMDLTCSPDEITEAVLNFSLPATPARVLTVDLEETSAGSAPSGSSIILQIFGSQSVTIGSTELYTGVVSGAPGGSWTYSWTVT